jgi:hypothetical protein
MASLTGNNSTLACARFLFILIGEFLSMMRTCLGNTGPLTLQDVDLLTPELIYSFEQVSHLVVE